MKGCMKMKFMQIPNAKTRALEIENGSSSSIPMLVIETICFTQKISVSKLLENGSFASPFTKMGYNQGSTNRI